MIELLDIIKDKINRKIKPESISLVDNSSSHSKHKSFNPNKYHIKIIVKSEKLKKMSKIEAHKEIYSILKEEMKNKIHALEIEIK